MNVRPLLLLPACLLFLAPGCGPSEPARAESCQAIIDACHDVDTGVGEIGECHETAHDVGTAAACHPIEVRCVMLCQAAAGDGGAHDSGAP